jgi:plasmid stability protein
MDTTIRNLDSEAYRRLKAHAALAGMTIGEAMNEAIRTYLAQQQPFTGSGSLADWEPEAYPAGNERLSEEIDRIVYGA